MSSKRPVSNRKGLKVSNLERNSLCESKPLSALCFSSFFSSLTAAPQFWFPLTTIRAFLCIKVFRTHCTLPAFQVFQLLKDWPDAAFHSTQFDWRQVLLLPTTADRPSPIIVITLLQFFFPECEKENSRRITFYWMCKWFMLVTYRKDFESCPLSPFFFPGSDIFSCYHWLYTVNGCYFISLNITGRIKAEPTGCLFLYLVKSLSNQKHYSHLRRGLACYSKSDCPYGWSLNIWGNKKKNKTKQHSHWVQIKFRWSQSIGELALPTLLTAALAKNLGLVGILYTSKYLNTRL